MVSSITHQRSASYPPKSNPIIQKIEDELKNLRKSESSSTSITQTICIGLKGLSKLYKFVDDMLNMPIISQRTTLSLNLSKHGNFLIEGSSKLLDICETSRRILEKFLLECCSNNDQLKISSYCCLRKEMIKSVKSLGLQLRQVEGSFVLGNDDNNEDYEVIRVLRCVCIINISVIESLLGFLGMPLMKLRKLGLFSKLVIKKSKNVISEKDLPECGNELSNVDLVLINFDEERFENNNNNNDDFAKKKLEVLEVSLRGIDDGLSKIIKQLSKTRASIMSIISA